MNIPSMDMLRGLVELAITTKVVVPAECGEINGHYYAFLNILATGTFPRLIVELGTGREARSAAHFAAGAPLAKVIGIDFEPPNFLPYPNIEWWKGDTRQMAERVKDLGMPIDLLFIDSDHRAAHAREEFDLYWPLLVPGGVLLVDDLDLGDMRSFWNTLPEPKFEDDRLHTGCGFGVVVKG